MVSHPLPWPLPGSFVSSITNWLADYRIEVREMVGATAVSTWSSGTLYAVPGGIDPELFLELSVAGTDIFAARLLNPDANRFLTVYAGPADTAVTLPRNPAIPAGYPLLFFMAAAGESFHIEVPASGNVYDYSVTAPGLYCINPAPVAHQPLLVTFNGAPFTVTVSSEIPATAWPLRSWLFLNHFSVFEYFVSTGRAQTTVTRPENTASRYIPQLDAFHDIDLPSKPVETIKLPSGYANASQMHILRHLSLTDWLYLITGLGLIYYVLKKSAVAVSDDSRTPQSSGLEAVRSFRLPVAPVYTVNLAVLYIDPASVTLGWRSGATVFSVVSVYDGQPAAWSFIYTPGDTGALPAVITRIGDEALWTACPHNTSVVLTRSGKIEVTQDISGVKAAAVLQQIPSASLLRISPNEFVVDCNADTSYCEVQSTVDGVDSEDGRSLFRSRMAVARPGIANVPAHQPLTE